MNNFTYYAPTKVFFGKNANDKAGAQIKNAGAKKVLIHYGGGSARKSGLLDKITDSLKAAQLEVVQLGGVEPNPKLSLVREGAELCRRENVDFILAVGGGSVIDSAKGIALSVGTGADCWDLITGKVPATASLPVAASLTLSAAGSEMSNSVVITNEDIPFKKGLNTDLVRPVMAFMDPQTTYTVSKYQTACGVVDIMMHTLERYYTAQEEIQPTDAIAEAVLLTVKNAGAVAVKEPDNYEARAAIMWASSLSHNGLTGCGKSFKTLTVHQLEHALSGKYDRIAHGAGLAVLYPAWAKYVYKHDEARFKRLAEKVWGIPAGTENAALLGIEAMKNYFAEIGMPVSLRELDVFEDSFEEMANMVTAGGKNEVPSFIPLGNKEIMDIFELAK